VRIGGFGGPDGLREFLLGQRIDVVVDATHPFADTITGNAAIACRAAGIPLLRLSRPGWSAGPGDNWIRVPDLAAAAARVTELGERIFLTIGRQGVGAFAGHSDRWFLIRAIDPPDAALPAHHELLLARGPFTVEAESELLARHRIDVLVTKDSGGADTAAKLTAGRLLGASRSSAPFPMRWSGCAVAPRVAVDGALRYVTVRAHRRQKKWCTIPLGLATRSR
jgi:precorrin-6A/cobalt-precorrin-6A reductase